MAKYYNILSWRDIDKIGKYGEYIQLEKVNNIKIFLHGEEPKKLDV